MSASTQNQAKAAILLCELLLQLQGAQWLVASLLYGTGMRIREALRLRVKDVQFERRERIEPAGCLVTAAGGRAFTPSQPA